MATTTEVPVRQTYKEYCATPDDERYELINGRLMMVPAPNMKHQEILGKLYLELGRFNREHGLGKVYVAPCDVFLSDTDVVQPDVLFISRAREHTVTRAERARSARPRNRDTLAVHRRPDLGEKHELYERHGVLEYWIVDPVTETVAVHRQGGGKLELAKSFGREDTLRTALLNGLEVKLGRHLWELTNPCARGE